MNEPDIHDALVQVLLGLFVALFWGLLLIVLVAAALGGAAGLSTGDNELLFLVVVLAVEAVVLFALGLPAAVALVGLRLRAAWGYWTAVVTFVLMLGGVCLPVGLYGLWALLIREGAKDRYTGG